MEKSIINNAFLILLVLSVSVSVLGRKDNVSTETWYKKQALNAYGAKKEKQQTHGFLSFKRQPLKHSSWAIALLGGALNYPGVKNVNAANPVGGLQLQWQPTENFRLSGDFLYSRQASQITRWESVDAENIDHYLFSLGTGYNFLNWVSIAPSWLEGFLGGVLTRSRRQFNIDENGSGAWDAGVSASLAFQVSSSLRILIDYRYLQNINYEEDTPTQGPSSDLMTSGRLSDLESLDYQMLLLSSSLCF